MHSLAADRPVSDWNVGIVPIHWPVGPEGVDHQLSEIQRLGFTGVQLGDQFPRGEALADLLAQHDLRVAEVYAALHIGGTCPRRVRRRSAAAGSSRGVRR